MPYLTVLILSNYSKNHKNSKNASVYLCQWAWTLTRIYCHCFFGDFVCDMHLAICKCYWHSDIYVSCFISSRGWYDVKTGLLYPDCKWIIQHKATKYATEMVCGLQGLFIRTAVGNIGRCVMAWRYERCGFSNHRPPTARSMARTRQNTSNFDDHGWYYFYNISAAIGIVESSYSSRNI